MTRRARGLVMLAGLCTGVVIAALVQSRAAPDGWERVRPNADMRRWWEQTERCTGLQGSMNGTIFLAPADGAVVVDRNRWLVGARIPGYIILRDFTDSLMFRHEARHALERDATHGPIGRCAGLMRWP